MRIAPKLFNIIKNTIIWGDILEKVIGKINSIQTLGTLDGPGVRFIAFLQGCNLKCGCCHNPETISFNGGKEYTPEELVNKVLRSREYFGEKGGITLSGGEPLLQADFAREVFALCHQNGINTCIDTSGSVINDSVINLLDLTDHILLDIKYTDEESYRKYAGCSLEKPLEFLKIVNDKKIPVTLRQVIIPTLNDNEENIKKLSAIAKGHECVVKTELLPFKKLCVTKYEKLGLDFPFKEIPEPQKFVMDELTKLI